VRFRGALGFGFALLGVVFAVTLVVWARAMAGAYPGLGPPQLTNGMFLAMVIALSGIARWAGSTAWGEAYIATLVAVAPVVPFLSAILILLLYVRQGGGPHADPVFLGLSTALGSWILGAPPLMWMARADTAQTRSYGEVLQRTTRAGQRLKVIRPESGSGGERAAMIIQADSYLHLLEGELGIGGQPGAGFRYANATGYINLWRALHRLEESLIALLPRPEVFAGAMYDAFRIGGIPNSDKLLAKVQQALAVFGDAAAPAQTSNGVTPTTNEAAQPAAFFVLVEVRHALNVDQDDTWERLIRQRNRLLRTVLVTSFVGLLLVVLAVAFHVSTETLAAAAVFYLVGALIGLFARLRAENNAGPAVDDYGLFEARLLATLLLSGLASVVGVVIVAFGAGVLVSEPASATTPSLMQIFSLAHNTRGLLAAAIFGLTPELLTGWLTKQSNAVMAQLASTSPAKDTGRTQ
jgi:hypothetical protein